MAYLGFSSRSVKLIVCRLKSNALYEAKRCSSYMKFLTTAGFRWRESQGMHRETTKDDMYIQGADWSYADGRPGNLSPFQRKEYKKQKEYALQVVQLLKEVKRAEDLHSKKVLEDKVTRQKLLENKLKPKGKNFKESLITE